MVGIRLTTGSLHASISADFISLVIPTLIYGAIVVLYLSVRKRPGRLRVR